MRSVSERKERIKTLQESTVKGKVLVNGLSARG